MRKILCILLYDQECMVRNNNDNNCDEQSSSYSSFIIMGVTFTTLQKSNEASCIISENIINIDWFNTLLNYSLIILNSIMVLSLMRVINNNYNNEDFGKQELQQSVHGCGTEVPSHLSTCLCFAFGKRLFSCDVCIFGMTCYTSSLLCISSSNYTNQLRGQSIHQNIQKFLLFR